MASLQRKGDSWYCQFLSGGKRHTFSVGRVSEPEAKAKVAQADYLLMRLRQGLDSLPAGVGIVDFLRHDGNPPASSPESAPAAAKPAEPTVRIWPTWIVTP